jgi:hypothetical protein
MAVRVLAGQVLAVRVLAVRVRRVMMAVSDACCLGDRSPYTM